ncbi:uncharacterized protein LOC143248720 isoform X2 [Tachypleus tridentatus]
MGWTKGKGLGKNEDGNLEHIKVSYKNDNTGIGYRGYDDTWVTYQSDFNSVLANLNGHECNSSTFFSDGITTNNKFPSLESKSKKSRNRVHYHKFIKGKDVSQYSSDDIASIFGNKKKKAVDSAFEESSKDNSDVENISNGMELQDNIKTFHSGTSVQDYFAKKMAEILKGKKEKAELCSEERETNGVGANNSGDDTCSDEHLNRSLEASYDGSMKSNGEKLNVQKQKKKVRFLDIYLQEQENNKKLTNEIPTEEITDMNIMKAGLKTDDSEIYTFSSKENSTVLQTSLIPTSSTLSDLQRKKKRKKEAVEPELPRHETSEERKEGVEITDDHSCRTQNKTLKETNDFSERIGEKKKSKKRKESFEVRPHKEDVKEINNLNSVIERSEAKDNAEVMGDDNTFSSKKKKKKKSVKDVEVKSDQIHRNSNEYLSVTQNQIPTLTLENTDKDVIGSGSCNAKKSRKRKCINDSCEDMVNVETGETCEMPVSSGYSCSEKMESDDLTLTEKQDVSTVSQLSESRINKKSVNLEHERFTGVNKNDFEFYTKVNKLKSVDKLLKIIKSNKVLQTTNLISVKGYGI